MKRPTNEQKKLVKNLQQKNLGKSILNEHIYKAGKQMTRHENLGLRFNPDQQHVNLYETEFFLFEPFGNKHFISIARFLESYNSSFSKTCKYSMCF